MEITQEKEIRIADLKEAFEEIKKSDDGGESIWFRELTSIDNAINFLEKI